MDRNRLKKTFEQYVSGYNADDTKIRLKIDHSYRVAELSEQIARTVDGADAEFAWMIGLLHDVGRFEQVRRFGTFIDAESIDHAQLGADLLFHEGLLEQLAGGDMDEEHRHLLETAIRAHNAYRIPEGLTTQEAMYCNILRDADKIDIFRVLWDIPPEEIYDVPLEEMKAAAVSDEVKECFYARTAVLRSKRKTPIDKIVGHICLTFELVYPISRQIAREQGYVDRLLAFPSENEDTAQWFAYMREHIWEHEGECERECGGEYEREHGRGCEMKHEGESIGSTAGSIPKGNRNCVIFDMDGVIFDTERFYMECCVPAAEKVGLENMKEVAYQCTGLTEEATEELLLAYYGEDAPLAEFHEETGRIFRDRYEKEGLPLKKGAREILEYLKANGARIAIGSSTRVDIVRKELQDAKLYDYFDVIVGGDMVEHSKPQPDVFLRAANDLGADIKDCYIVEDSFNGVRAARSAGGTVLMVPDLREPTEEIRNLADHVFESLLEVLEFFRGIYH